jgi:purine-binding chemotaxis protein CheW
MPLDGGASQRVLVVRAGSRLLAVASRHVVETMRPLAVAALAGVPNFVLGAAIIRGIPTPVVDVAALLGMVDPRPERFVTIRVGEHFVALAVESVVGMRSLDVESLPPLTAHAVGGAVDAIGRLDAELVLVLAAARVVPDDIWQAVGA